MTLPVSISAAPLEVPIQKAWGLGKKLMASLTAVICFAVFNTVASLITAMFFFAIRQTNVFAMTIIAVISVSFGIHLSHAVVKKLFGNTKSMAIVWTFFFVSLLLVAGTILVKPFEPTRILSPFLTCIFSYVYFGKRSDDSNFNSIIALLFSVLNPLVLAATFIFVCLVQPFKNGIDGESFLRQLAIIPAWGLIIAGYFSLSGGKGKLLERLTGSLALSIPFMIFCAPGVVIAYWIGRYFAG